MDLHVVAEFPAQDVPSFDKTSNPQEVLVDALEIPDGQVTLLLDPLEGLNGKQPDEPQNPNSSSSNPSQYQDGPSTDIVTQLQELHDASMQESRFINSWVQTMKDYVNNRITAEEDESTSSALAPQVDFVLEAADNVDVSDNRTLLRPSKLVCRVRQRLPESQGFLGSVRFATQSFGARMGDWCKVQLHQTKIRMESFSDLANPREGRFAVEAAWNTDDKCRTPQFHDFRGNLLIERVFKKLEFPETDTNSVDAAIRLPREWTLRLSPSEGNELNLLAEERLRMTDELARLHERSAVPAKQSTGWKETNITAPKTPPLARRRRAPISGVRPASERLVVCKRSEPDMTRKSDTARTRLQLVGGNEVAIGCSNADRCQEEHSDTLKREFWKSQRNDEGWGYAVPAGAMPLKKKAYDSTEAFLGGRLQKSFFWSS
jgi:hypothetical protein